MNFYLHGVQKARYYLIGADSGVGKTSLADFMFILELWRDSIITGKKLRVLYYSFEISGDEKVAAWISYLISVKYSVDLPVDYIMGNVEDNLLSDEHMAMVEECSKIVAEMLEFITIRDTPMHPTAIFHEALDMAEELGTIHREEKVNHRVKDKDGNPTKVKYITGYSPNDPELTMLLMLDHVALAIQETGLSPKANIDRLSSYGVFLRNKLGMTVCFIQQFNTEMQTVERRKFSQAAFAPQRGDFGDSKYTYRDADVVIGLIKPSFFDLERYYDYPVQAGGSSLIGLGDNFVAAFLMKNRYGTANKMMPLFMNGISKRFYDLPLDPNSFEVEEFTEETTRLTELCQLYSQPRLPPQVE